LERSEVAIIIPAFNEVASIAGVVESISRFGKAIVVDDGSSDRTASLAEASGAVVVRHKANLGYDGALNSGFAEAERLGFCYAVTFDADGQHPPRLIEVFVNRLKEGNELVIGTRPRSARLSEGLFLLYMRFRFGVFDPLCGMKGYRMSLYRERGWFDSYQSIGTELMIYALRMRKPFAQVPVPISERKGRSRFGQSWKANYKIFRAMALSLIR
jgi:glycosyltransferase involved in cell wall biosynthesis